MKNHSYISMQQDMPDQGQLQVFRFGTSEEMLGGCLRLYERMGNKAGENRLYG